MTRYVFEYKMLGGFVSEWHPKFFTKLESVIEYKERMMKNFNKNKISYRIVKELVTKEILEEGKNYRTY